MMEGKHWFVLGIGFLFVLVLTGYVGYINLVDDPILPDQMLNRLSEPFSAEVNLGDYERLEDFQKAWELEQERIRLSENLTGNVIGYIPEESWVWRIIEQDELGVTIFTEKTREGDWNVTVVPYVVNNEKVDRKDYEFKIGINYTGDETLVKQRLSKEELNKEYHIIIPKEENKVRIRIGENSTLIEGTTSSVATKTSGLTSFCRNTNGEYVTAYHNGSGSIAIAITSDLDSGVWNTTGVPASGFSTHQGVGVACGGNNKVFVWTSETSFSPYYFKYYNSTDGGRDFGNKQYVIDKSTSLVAWMNGATDKEGHVHWCLGGVQSRGLYYLNDTMNPSSPITLSDDSGDDIDYCDIEVAEDGDVYVFGMGTDGDDLDVFVKSNSWSRQQAFNGVNWDISADTNFDTQIRTIDGTEHIVACIIDAADLQFCNSTTSNSPDFDCQELDSSNSRNCDISIAEDGRIFILYESGTFGYLANSSLSGELFSDWSVRQTIDTSEPSYYNFLDANYPINNRLNTSSDGLLHFVYTEEQSGIEGVYYGNYSISPSEPFVDAKEPYYSNILFDPMNNSDYVNGACYDFNITWNDETAFDTSIIQFEGVNYTPSSLGSVYNWSVCDLSVGDYEVVWYGNDTTGNSNQTDLLIYSITQATPSATFTSTRGFNYAYSENTFGLSESNEGDVDVVYEIFRNGTSIGTGESVTLGVGSYLFILNNTAGVNYTSINPLDTQTVNISQAGVNLSLSFNVTSPVVYPYNFRINCSRVGGEVPLEIYINGTSYNNNTGIELGVGVYNVSCQSPESQNYTFAVNETTFEVTKLTGVVHTKLNNSRSNLGIIQGENVLINGSLETGEGIIAVYSNGTLINNGSSPLVNLSIYSNPGVYNISTVYDGNQNFTSAVENFFLTVNVAPDEAPPLFLGQDILPLNNSVYSYGTNYHFNASFNDTSGVSSVKLTFNGINYSMSYLTGDIYTVNIGDLPAGTYNYYYWSEDVGGLENETEHFTYVIQQASLSATLTSTAGFEYNHTSSTFGVSESNLGDQDVTYTIYRNGTNVGSSETITLIPGVYFYILNSTGGVNYTSSIVLDTQTVNVSTADPSLSLSALPSFNVAEGLQSNVSGNSCPSELSCNLYRDGVLVSNPDVQTLITGLYNYTFNTTGNQNYTGQVVSAILNISPDLTSPEVNFSGQINYSTTLNFTYVQVSANDPQSSIDSCLADLGSGNETLSFVSGMIYANNFTGLSSANYTVNVYCNNTNNIWGTQTGWVNVTHDGLPPSITINNPINQSILSSLTTSVILNITTDETANCRYGTQIDLLYENMTEFTSTDSTTHLQTVSVSQGNDYDYFYSCKDNSPSQNINRILMYHYFEVAGTVAPNVTLVSPSNGFTSTEQDVVFTYIPDDDEGFYNKCELYANKSGNWQVIETDTSITDESSNTMTGTSFSNGSVVWNVLCEDSLGVASFAPSNFTLNFNIQNIERNKMIIRNGSGTDKHWFDTGGDAWHSNNLEVGNTVITKFLNVQNATANDLLLVDSSLQEFGICKNYEDIDNGNGTYARLKRIGSFKGGVDSNYTIRIDTSGGTECDSARFNYSDDGTTNWDETNIITSCSDPIQLAGGFFIYWESSPTADFVDNLEYKFTAFADVIGKGDCAVLVNTVNDTIHSNEPWVHNTNLTSYEFCLDGECIQTWQDSVVGSFNLSEVHDQDLNTTSNVTFNKVTLNKSLSAQAIGTETVSYLEYTDGSNGCSFEFLGGGVYNIPVFDCGVLDDAINLFASYGSTAFVDKNVTDNTYAGLFFSNKSLVTYASLSYNTNTNDLVFTNDLGGNNLFDANIVTTGLVNGSNLTANSGYIKGRGNDGLGYMFLDDDFFQMYLNGDTFPIIDIDTTNIEFNSQGYDLDFYITKSGGTPKFMFEGSNGWVSIGGTTPKAQLDVRGDVLIQDFVNISGNVFVNKSVNATNFFQGGNTVCDNSGNCDIYTSNGTVYTIVNSVHDQELNTTSDVKFNTLNSSGNVKIEGKILEVTNITFGTQDTTGLTAGNFHELGNWRDASGNGCQTGYRHAFGGPIPAMECDAFGGAIDMISIPNNILSYDVSDAANNVIYFLDNVATRATITYDDTNSELEFNNLQGNGDIIFQDQIEVNGEIRTSAGNDIIAATTGNVQGADINATSEFCLQGDCIDTWDDVNVSSADTDWNISGKNVYPTDGSAHLGVQTNSPEYAIDFRVRNMSVGLDNNLGSGLYDYKFAFGSNLTVSQDHSVAFGKNNRAESQFGIAAGRFNNITGTSSAVFGQYNRVGGVGLVAGQGNVATSFYNLLVGLNLKATAQSASALGNSNVANGTNSLAIGLNTQAESNQAFAAVSGSIARGVNSVAVGTVAIANGTQSMAFGERITVNGENSIAFGLDAITDTISQNNAFVITGGNVGIEDTTPQSTLTVAGTLNVSNSVQFDGKSLFGADIDVNDANLLMTGISGTQNRIHLNGDASDPTIELFHIGSSTILLDSFGDSYFDGGSLSIGTQTPTALLTVEGDTNITGNLQLLKTLEFDTTDADGAFITSPNNANLSIIVRSNQAGEGLHVIDQNGAPQMSMLTAGGTAGYVGFGTTSPDGDLEINDITPDFIMNASGTTGRFRMTFSGGNIQKFQSVTGLGTPGFEFECPDENQCDFRLFQDNNGNNVNDRSFWIYPGNGTTSENDAIHRLSTKGLDSYLMAGINQDLGIGTRDNPTEKLHLKGNMYVEGTVLTNTTCQIPGTTIWAEEGAALSTATSGGLQFSFGNGNVAAHGIAQPCYGEVVAASMACENSAASTGRVQIAINGAAQGTGCELQSPGSNNGDYIDSSCAVSFSTGDQVSFITTTSEAGTDGCVVSAWIVYGEN